MSQLTTLPLQDNYRTTLSQARDGNTGTVYVNTVPSFTFPAGVKTYICVDAGKTTMQVARISAYDATLKTITVDSISFNKANGVAYSAQNHLVGAVVEISDNYQFRDDIKTAINTKVNTNSTDTDTGKFADATARDAYFTSPVNGNSAYLTTEGKRTDYIGGAWADRASGTNPNASTTVAGKVEKATSGEVTAGTATGGTGAELFVGPAEMKSVIDGLTQARAFGNGSDGDVTINSGTTTLSRDMYYNNLTITSPGVLNPNGYRVFVSGTFSGNGTISRNGNNGGSASGGTGGSAGTLGQGSLNMEKSAGAGANSPGNTSSGIAGSAGTSSNPSMTNISGAAGGTGGSTIFGGGTGGSAGTSTRGSSYNTYGFAYVMHLATAQSRPTALSYGSIASSGGGGSGATNGAISATGGGGGGGGGNGGFIRIACKIWDFVGTITATGGNGGNGGNAAVSGVGGAGGGGGGGGGNGGIILRIYYKLLNDCTKILTGGTGGTGGALAGNGSNGSAGTNGNTGETISIQI